MFFRWYGEALICSYAHTKHRETFVSMAGATYHIQKKKREKKAAVAWGSGGSGGWRQIGNKDYENLDSQIPFSDYIN